jgi:hypothetical protein
MSTENKDGKPDRENGTDNKPSTAWDWDDDKVIFIPDEDYYAIQRAIRNIEQAQEELKKLRMENG